MQELKKVVNNYAELPELLTVSDLQKVLRISRPKAYSLVHQADFPSVFLGRTIRIPTRALRNWLENQSTNK